MTKDQVYDMLQKEELSGELAMDLGSAIAFEQISYDDVENVVDQYCEDNRIDKETKRLFIDDISEYSQK